MKQEKKKGKWRNQLQIKQTWPKTPERKRKGIKEKYPIQITNWNNLSHIIKAAVTSKSIERQSYSVNGFVFQSRYQQQNQSQIEEKPPKNLESREQ